MDTYHGTSSPTVLQRFIRPLFDWLIGLILALLTLPVVLILAIGSWIAFGWPPITRTSYIGRNDTRFNLFRINRHPEWGTDLRGRSRRFSEWLHSTGADRLPHIWSVVRGHMALVGPRPLHPSNLDDVDEIPVLSARPGLTPSWGRGSAGRVRSNVS